MSFLNNTGLAYFYNKLKQVFPRSINGETPDALGNIRINEVELAKNLTAPDAQASIDTFIYRTSGGSASLQSGEANLVLINGNMEIEGRIIENVSFNTTNDLLVNVDDLSLLRNAVNNTTGNYILTYTCPTSGTITTDWEPDVGEWTYASESTSLASWGLLADNLTAPSILINATSTGITQATVVPNSFTSMVSHISNTYIFNYVENIEEEITNSYWSLNDNVVSLNNYGIQITGTPADGDIIEVSYIAGTQNGTLTVSYTAPDQGQIKVANPTKFISTGFNQFDKDSTDLNQSGVIENATISNDSIISNSGTYVCYCKAVGGEHGYIAESLGEHIVISGGMGWCANIPEIGSAVVTTSAKNDDSVTSTSADFTYMQDGYILVVVNNTSDLMMWCEWSGDVNGQQTYTAYVAPSEVNIPTIGYIEGVQYNLPTASYGMPRLGTVYDTINFEAGTYIKRIERLSYSPSNLAYIQAMEPVPTYDYDDTNIFYVLPSPVTYTFIGSDGIYQVDDHGTEEFIGTIVPIAAEMLYGQNLRDKLRTDVLTISAQNPPLTSHQKEQVLKNIGISYSCNLNLLDNWYFVGGGTGAYGVFPINQRGQASYSTNEAYGIDRWVMRCGNGLKWTVGADGLSNDGSNSGTFMGIIQPFPNKGNLIGKTITFSALITACSGTGRLRIADASTKSQGGAGAGGAAPDQIFSAPGLVSLTFTIPSTWTDNFHNFIICKSTGDNTTFTVAAAKLELGDTQTLAHQENGVWVLNEVPDYETELLRCKTSMAEPSDTYANDPVGFGSNIGIVQNTNTATQDIPKDRYVIWHGALYKASAAIASGATLSSSNLKTASGGGLNDLKNMFGIKSFSDLGLTTPTTIRDIVNALPYGGSFVISINAGQVTDANHTGELYIRTPVSSYVIHKTDLVLRKNTAGTTSLSDNYLVGMLPGSGNVKWYAPTLTEQQ